MTVDEAAVRAAVRALLEAIGEDPDREGLEETPRRVARFWREFMDHAPGRTAVTFEAVATDQLVAVTGVRVWSLCEHHLLPFWCDVSIGYLARGRVLGISKLARIAEARAHRLQLQERLVEGVARDVAGAAETEAVAVVARGFHLCMAMRGVRSDALVTSSAVRGAFAHNPVLRREFMDLVAADGRPTL